MGKLWKYFAVFMCSSLSYADPVPIWDSHLHYNAFDAQLFKPQTIINKLKANHIEKAAITSNPPLLVQRLKKIDPDRILYLALMKA